jgi:ribA/ribD-fused uncharacterized protein
MATAQPDLRVYPPGSLVTFRKTNEPFGGLSNMAPGYPVEVAGVRIRTSEALYQACRFPHRPEVQKLIIDQTSPMTAKMLSKPYVGDSRPDWDAVRIPIMKWCLRVKLAQNWEKFGELLLTTGQSPIVEDSRKDDFWGALRDIDGSLRGRNVLGRLLMELRERLRTDPAALYEVQPLPIPQFLLFGGTIPAVQRSVPIRVVHDAPQSPFDFAEPQPSDGAETADVPVLPYPPRGGEDGGALPAADPAPASEPHVAPSSATEEWATDVTEQAVAPPVEAAEAVPVGKGRTTAPEARLLFWALAGAAAVGVALWLLAT